MTRVVTSALLAAAALAPTACTLVAGKGDYAAYREIRLAADEPARLVAMQRYVAANPDGAWAAEIQAERTRLEPEVYAQHRATREGLEFYLRAYPDGQYAAEAAPRLAALASVQGRRENEAQVAETVHRQRAADQEERRRTWITRASQFWTDTLLKITNWGSPIADVARANGTFSRAFGQDPRPRCSREECIKFYRADFAIPVPGATRIERRMELLLRLALREGRVTRAEVLMPNRGFSRWYEHENRMPVLDEDPAARDQAVAWAAERLVAAIRAAAPAASALANVTLTPIAPPTVRAPNQPDPGAGLAPGDEAAPAEDAPAGAAPEPSPAGPPTPPAPAPGPTPPGPGDGATPPDALEELLLRAAGTEEAAPSAPEAPTPPAAPEAPTPPAVPTAPNLAPVVRQAFTAGRLRVVIFSASPEDLGQAYDGLVIEGS